MTRRREKQCKTNYEQPNHNEGRQSMHKDDDQRPGHFNTIANIVLSPFMHTTPFVHAFTAELRSLLGSQYEFAIQSETE
eukprot:4457531-Amphidinium_carterae.2